MNHLSFKSRKRKSNCVWICLRENDRAQGTDVLSTPHYRNLDQPGFQVQTMVDEEGEIPTQLKPETNLFRTFKALSCVREKGRLREKWVKWEERERERKKRKDREVEADFLAAQCAGTHL